MTIIGILGEQGEGKTTLMSFFLYLHYLTGHKILTNYGPKFPHIKITSSFLKDKTALEKITQGKKASIGIDEIHLELDARSAMANKKKSFLLTQARKALKDKGDFFWTSQYLNQIDVRLRQNTKRVLVVEKVKRQGKEYFDITFLKSKFNDFIEYKKKMIPCDPIFSLQLHDTLEIVEALED